MAQLKKKRPGRLPRIEVVDLFCGIGGLSYGMKSAGFHILAGFDLDHSWYNGNDKKRIENVIEQLSLRNTSLIQLSDIILPHPKQLSLFK